MKWRALCWIHVPPLAGSLVFVAHVGDRILDLVVRGVVLVLDQLLPGPTLNARLRCGALPLETRLVPVVERPLARYDLTGVRVEIVAVRGLWCRFADLGLCVHPERNPWFRDVVNSPRLLRSLGDIVRLGCRLLSLDSSRCALRSRSSLGDLGEGEPRYGRCE